MIQLGDYNTLKIVKTTDFGLYLDGGEEGEILLPSRYVPHHYQIGDLIKVFIYLDQEERLIATTETPLARVGDFAYLEVAWVNQYGAFLNIGLTKDLFCPFREQKIRMKQGDRHIVYVKIDEESYRMMATAKVDRYLNSERPPYKHGDEVNLLVWQRTDLGFKVIIDNKYQGLIYDNQIYRHLHTGDTMKGYIDHIRQDNKVDITLQPTGRAHTEEFSAILLQYLKDNNGHCPLGDKSPSELIQDYFSVSKKTFKRAIGDLYKQRLIKIGDNGIDLI